MKCLHLSERFNRDSILKIGLRPSRIKLPNHLAGFRGSGLLAAGEDKIVYAWVDTFKNEKYIKDFIFCRQWQHPRNEITDRHPKWAGLFNYKKLGPDKFLGAHEQMLYDLYEFEADDNPPENQLQLHGQYHSDYEYCSSYGFWEEFAHDDKLLYLSKAPITNLKVVAEASYHFDGKYNITINRR